MYRLPYGPRRPVRCPEAHHLRVHFSVTDKATLLRFGGDVLGYSNRSYTRALFIRCEFSRIPTYSSTVPLQITFTVNTALLNYLWPCNYGMISNIVILRLVSTYKGRNGCQWEGIFSVSLVSVPCRSLCNRRTGRSSAIHSGLTIAAESRNQPWRWRQLSFSETSASTDDSTRRRNLEQHQQFSSFFPISSFRLSSFSYYFFFSVHSHFLFIPCFPRSPKHFLERRTHLFWTGSEHSDCVQPRRAADLLISLWQRAGRFAF